MFPTNQGKPDIILLSVVSLCAVVVIIVFYLIYLNYSPSKITTVNLKPSSPLLSSKPTLMPSANGGALSLPSKTSGSPLEPANQFDVPTSGSKEVFHIKNNIFSFDDAPAVCSLYGADLATLEQLKEAHRTGADWCSGGWTKEGLVAYPIQQSTYNKLQENDPQNRGICGQAGINLLRNQPELLYGVNCYGVKRRPVGAEKLKEKVLSDRDLEIQRKMAQFRQLDISLSPYNSDKWSEYK